MLKTFLTNMMRTSEVNYPPIHFFADHRDARTSVHPTIIGVTMKLSQAT